MTPCALPVPSVVPLSLDHYPVLISGILLGASVVVVIQDATAVSELEVHHHNARDHHADRHSETKDGHWWRRVRLPYGEQQMAGVKDKT